MANENTTILKKVLSDDEISKIPVEVFTKLEAFVEKNFEECLTSKALHQAERDSTSTL